MDKIHLISLGSTLLDEEIIVHKQKFAKNYLKDFIFSDELDALKIFFIMSGGVEGEFAKLYQNYPSPFILLIDQKDNSLASALEIISFLKDRHLNYLLLDGEIDPHIALTQYLYFKDLKTQMGEDILGVIGEPSNWLIASKCDYKLIKNKFNLTVIDIPYEELINHIDEQYYDEELYKRFASFIKDQNELIQALKVHQALLKICEKYHLKGLTIRCFDLLKLKNVTSCLSLGLLNEKGIVASCEGDVPSMVTMYLIKKILNLPSFQANPSLISQNKIILAHCSVPFNMCSSYQLLTHFESNKSLAIKGEMFPGSYTIVKFNHDFSKLFIKEVYQGHNLNLPHLCRTQIALEGDNLKLDLLNSGVANHMILVKGHYLKELMIAFNLLT